MFGTLTLILYSQTEMVTTDYYLSDLSERVKSAFCAHLDAIVELLCTESGIISSMIPLNAPGRNAGPSAQTSPDPSTGNDCAPKQRLLWDYGPEVPASDDPNPSANPTGTAS